MTNRTRMACSWCCLSVLLVAACSTGSSRTTSAPSTAPPSVVASDVAATPAATPTTSPAAPGSFAAAVAAAREELAADRDYAPGYLVYVGQGHRRTVLAEGLARVSPKKAMGADATVMLASLTKPLIAAAVMSYVQDGRLHLSDTVERWLPGLIARGSTIRIEHLLSMTSGLVSYDVVPGYPGGGQLPERRLIALNQSLDSPAVSKPGAEGSESNTNYALLGLILEAVSGKPFDAVVRDRVLAPLGLTHTRFGGTPSARGYSGGRDATVLDPPYPSAAAGGVGSLSDYGRFLGSLIGGRLLSRATVSAMEEVRTQLDGDDYGLGLRVRNPPGCSQGIIGAVGGNDGYALQAWVARASGRVVVVAATEGSAEDVVGALAERVLCA